MKGISEDSIDVNIDDDNLILKDCSSNSDVLSPMDKSVDEDTDKVVLLTAAKNASDKMKLRESLIKDHEGHVSMMAEILQSDMELLQETHQPSPNYAEYVTTLEELLQHKIELSTQLLKQIQYFKEKML